MTSKLLDEPKKIFGERIRLFRKHLGLTLERFAQPLSIKGNTVSDYERGKARASEAVLRELETHYQINRVWYETGEGAMRLPITGTSQEQSHFSESSRPAVDLTPEELEMIRIARECPEVVSVVRLMGEMDRDAQKAIQSRAEEKKLLQDLMKERLERKAG